MCEKGDEDGLTKSQATDAISHVIKTLARAK